MKRAPAQVHSSSSRPTKRLRKDFDTLESRTNAIVEALAKKNWLLQSSDLQGAHGNVLFFSKHAYPRLQVAVKIFHQPHKFRTELNCLERMYYFCLHCFVSTNLLVLETILPLVHSFPFVLKAWHHELAFGMPFYGLNWKEFVAKEGATISPQELSILYLEISLALVTAMDLLDFLDTDRHVCNTIVAGQNDALFQRQYFLEADDGYDF
jgi:hypothetical protein